jgi:hypothetical protein
LAAIQDIAAYSYSFLLNYMLRDGVEGWPVGLVAQAGGPDALECLAEVVGKTSAMHHIIPVPSINGEQSWSVLGVFFIIISQIFSSIEVQYFGSDYVDVLLCRCFGSVDVL